MSLDVKKVADALLTAVRELVEPAMHEVGERLVKIEAQIGTASSSLESTERRLSRHADHLARLESRLKALETK